VGPKNIILDIMSVLNVFEANTIVNGRSTETVTHGAKQ
jgi:hypothetical protein